MGLKKMKVKYSVIIPAYNEEKSILQTINTVKQVMKNLPYELIIINDASKDRTGILLRRIRGIKVITHPVNKGYGASLKSGLRVAQGEWVIITDADGTYPIKDIPRLLEYIPENDMVVGARIGRKVYVPPLRKPAKMILSIVSRIVTGMRIPDLNSGLRVFRKEVAMKFWNFYPNGFSFTTTLTIAMLVNNYNVKYIPINYYKRKGKSSINPLKDFIGFNFLIFRVALNFAPLKFFAPTSITLLVIGIIKGAIDFLNTGKIGIFAAILVLFSVQIFFFGLLADLVNKRLYS
ncbi:MAG TPA: glycosyltransferase family 2 protein [Candidatus Woesearchaeota archaeon]|nr:glycosyltransferase family 2 protein [Candidatus Woesearchaeota archaeon]